VILLAAKTPGHSGLFSTACTRVFSLSVIKEPYRTSTCGTTGVIKNGVGCPLLPKLNFQASEPQSSLLKFPDNEVIEDADTFKADILWRRYRQRIGAEINVVYAAAEPLGYRIVTQG